MKRVLDKCSRKCGDCPFPDEDICPINLKLQGKHAQHTQILRIAYIHEPWHDEYLKFILGDEED